MKRLMTLGQILFNVSILTVMFKSLWYFWPELLRYIKDPDWLTSSQITVIVMCFTFSPSKSDEDDIIHWKLKAEGRTAFVLFAVTYVALVEGIKATFL